MPKEKWILIERLGVEVSNLGRVRRYLEPIEHSHGYLQVKIGRSGNHYIHRLVAEAFLGPCPPTKEVHHKNHLKNDNKAKNLSYVTHLENLQEMTKTGRGVLGKRGESNPGAVLSQLEVDAIREDYKAGMRQFELSLKYRVARSTVNNIVHERRWK